MSQKSFYITTTLPYVNASPHIGFAMEIVAADIIARYHRLLGENVIFNTGTDEHGQKIYEKALENKVNPQAYVDEYAAKFDELKILLDLSYDKFIRTTDEKHKIAAQEFWNRCYQNGDIYKKEYTVKYCVGCELEKTDSELLDGKCPLHPNQDLELRNEDNYFFRFSKYQEKLLELYKNNPEFVKPGDKLKEITSFVENGLQDFSISRLKSKMPWGVEVPNDSEHVMYVWFDALVNYVSTIGWPNNLEEFNHYWPVVQIAGKDNLRQQSAMWQAMLMSAQIPPSQKILINGFISVAGAKMSKSLGNVISPNEMVERYGVEGTRYLLAAIGPIGNDIDITWQRFDEMYTSMLSNRLGNLVSRVAKLCERNDITFTYEPISKNIVQNSRLENFNISEALEGIFTLVKKTDSFIDETQPWKMKNGPELTENLAKLVEIIREVAMQLLPFLPKTSEKILSHFANQKITAIAPLFPRLPQKN